MKLLRIECERNVRLVLPHWATTLPPVTIRNAADPSDSTLGLSAATRSDDQPSASSDDADSHVAPGTSVDAGRWTAARPASRTKSTRADGKGTSITPRPRLGPTVAPGGAWRNARSTRADRSGSARARNG